MATIVCFGEMLLRLSAPARARLQQADRLIAQYVGAEANVAVSLAQFKHRVRYVTALPDTILGKAARAAVTAHGVTVTAPALADSRLGTLYLETGAGERPSAIIYDRKYSAFATCPPEQYDWQALLEDAQWLHVSGISLALSATARTAVLQAVEQAAAMGVAVSFDCNFRPSLWRGNEEQAASLMRDVARHAQLIFGGAKDAAFLFDLAAEHRDPQEDFRRASEKFFEFSPSIAHVAATSRLVESADSNILRGFLADRQQCVAAEPRTITHIVDRIGAGDAFAAGVLHKLVGAASLQETIDFALAAAAFKHTIPGDFTIASETEIQALSNETTDIQR